MSALWPAILVGIGSRRNRWSSDRRFATSIASGGRLEGPRTLPHIPSRFPLNRRGTPAHGFHWTRIKTPASNRWAAMPRFSSHCSLDGADGGVHRGGIPAAFPSSISSDASRTGREESCAWHGQDGPLSPRFSATITSSFDHQVLLVAPRG